jgi:formylglycine-generating enzyme required for sulfatase activity
MSVDVAERLRSLAQDHHDGKLDLAAYRALRAPLLESLSTSSVSRGPEITQPRGAVRQPPREAITQPGKPRAVPPEMVSTVSAPAHQPAAPSLVSSSGARQPSRLAIIIVVALILVLAIALWVLFGRTGSSPTATQPGPSAVGTSSAELIERLVQSFVGTGDWSDARVTTFNVALAQIGGGQIGTVAHERWFREFADDLRRRLKEQQALSPTRLTVDNSPLAALAVTVGIDLDSPDSALHIAPLPAPSPAEAVQGANAGVRRVQRVATTGAGEALRVGEAAQGSARSASVAGDKNGATTARAAATPGAAAKPGAPVAATAAPGQDARSTALAAANTASGAAGDVRNRSNAQSPAQAASHSDAAAPADSCRAELARSRRPLCHDLLSGGAAGPEMAVVPAGAFDMGSTAAPEEQPLHHVTIGQPFAVSVYEVSQGEFKRFCDATHRSCAQQPWSGDDYPVVEVSWDDARAYTDWLTAVTHHHYGLPTEAQWEYAARAGTTGLYPNGDSTLSPTDADYSVSKLQTVAARRSERFNANAFRLMHTLGNVREWVEDAWVQNYKGAPDDGTAVRSTRAAMRVARGGSYADGASRLRLSLREGLAPGTRDVTTGFRIVRELP